MSSNSMFSKSAQCLFTACALLPVVALANTAPVTTDLGYHFSLVNDQAINVTELMDTSGGYSAAVLQHQPLTGSGHALSASTGINEHWMLDLAYQYQVEQGNSVVALYSETTDINLSGSNKAWTNAQQGDGQAVVKGLLSEVRETSRQNIALGGRFYAKNLITGVAMHHRQHTDDTTVGGKFDIALDGNKDQLQYSVGLGYLYTELTPQFDPNRSQAQQVVKQEAYGEGFHTVMASQAITVDSTANTRWRIAAGVNARIGYLSDPNATVAIACGTACQNDASTTVDEATLQTGGAVIDYRTEFLPELIVGWNIDAGLRQYVNGAGAAVQWDLGYGGNTLDIHSVSSRLAWAQSVAISSSSSTGIARWFERQNTSILLTPYTRVAGQVGLAQILDASTPDLFDPITDPELIEAIYADEDLGTPNDPDKSGNVPSTAPQAGDNGGYVYSGQTYYSADPSLANFLGYAFGVDAVITIADVSLTFGYESYSVKSDIAGQIKLPGLEGYSLLSAGLDYKF